MESLTRLVLDKCDLLHVLPKDIGQLTKFGFAEGASLQSLPESFEHLPKLRRQELFNCALQRLPAGFGKLASLEIFKVGTKEEYDRHGLSENEWLGANLDIFGSCALRTLPQSLTLLTRLEELVLDGCDLRNDPPMGMGNLSSLKVLKVRNCDQLSYLPSLLTPRMQALALQAGPACTSAALAAASDPPFPSLENLEISGCPRLESLPEGLQMLPKLEHFTLKDCPSMVLVVWSPFPSLPPFPVSLTTISISNTFQNVKSLPESFLSLSRLCHLDLHSLRLDEYLIAHSAVTNTPAPARASLNLLSSLVHLHILDSYLPALPGNLDDLGELKVLSLFKCHCISSLPPVLYNLSKLEHLSLDSLPLTHLPDNLGQFTALVKLTLQSCKALQGLPSTLTLPSSLRLMTVANCPGISSLPDSISSLSHLTSLELRSLVGLYHLPSSLALLPSLVKLSLQGCKWLRALPDGLGSLSCLREVDLGGCAQLTELPQSLQKRMNVIEVNGRWGRRRGQREPHQGETVY
ncbi:unnamed protein product [Closterium sp. NIES-65]|nr:unnamed protein product [Closterium sp. NIES-65]